MTMNFIRYQRSFDKNYYTFDLLYTYIYLSTNIWTRRFKTKEASQVSRRSSSSWFFCSSLASTLCSSALSKASLIINRPGGASMPLINDNYQAIIQAAAWLDYPRKVDSGIVGLASSPSLLTLVRVFTRKFSRFPRPGRETMFLAVGESRFLSKVFPESSFFLSFFFTFFFLFCPRVSFYELKSSAGSSRVTASTGYRRSFKLEA